MNKILQSVVIITNLVALNNAYSMENMDHHMHMMNDSNHDITVTPQSSKKNTISMNIVSLHDNKGKKIVQIKLNNIKDNKPVTLSNLKEVHTKKVHLLIIDDSLEDYSHIHPKEISNGLYEFEWTPKKLNGNYKIWADLFPIESNAQEFVVADLLPKTPHVSQINRKKIMENNIEGYHFKLTFDTDQLAVNKPTLGTIIVTDTNNKPVKDLAPVMGAFAHIVGFNDDIKTVVHVHPMGIEPTNATDRGGPELQFHINPEKKGFVKFFAQMNIQGKEIFVPFAVNVD